MRAPGLFLGILSSYPRSTLCPDACHLYDHERLLHAEGQENACFAYCALSTRLTYLALPMSLSAAQELKSMVATLEQQVGSLRGSVAKREDLLAQLQAAKTEARVVLAKAEVGLPFIGRPKAGTYCRFKEDAAGQQSIACNCPANSLMMT